MNKQMKDSGIVWVGDIPSNWRIVRVSFLYDITLGKMVQPEPLSDNDTYEKYLCAANLGKNTLKLEDIKSMWFNASEKQNLLLKKGDLLVVEGGDVASSDIICQDVENLYFQNALHRVRGIKGNDNRFLRYLLMTAKSEGYIDLICNKATIAHFSKEKFSSMRIPIPDILAQEKIADFIDKKCTQINYIINESRKSIEEYRKLKQSCITHAVTKGVRKDRLLKDAGIDWTDKIPQELSVTRVGMIFDIILGKMLCSSPPDDSYTFEPYYCAADVHFDGISTTTERKQMWFSPAEKELYLVKNGDLLVVEGGAGAGGCAVVINQTEQTYVQNSIMIVRSKGRIDIRYLRYWLECLVKQGYIDVVCNKATIPHFTKDKLANVPIIVFSLEESEEIADYLDEKCSQIDDIIAKKEKLIVELEAYKESLIYEYVTGKKEVC